MNTTIAAIIVAAAMVSGCTSPGRRVQLPEAFLACGDEKVSFISPSVVQEQEVTVFVGECHSRRMAAANEAMYDIQKADFQKAASAKEFLKPRIDPEYSLARTTFGEEEARAVRVIVTAQTVSLIDQSTVPMHSAGLTAVGSFRSNARYVSICALFPEDGDTFQIIIDVRRGTFVVIDRWGSDVLVRQSFERPRFY